MRSFADGLQHPAVYTIGKRGKPHDFLKSTDQLTGLGAEIHTAPRGGETTFHGPGQLVMYPIVNLRRLRIGARAYVEGLEDTVIGALSQLGIQAQVSSHTSTHGMLSRNAERTCSSL